MGTRDVVFTILAIDKASKTLERTGLAAEGAGAKLKKFGEFASKALVGVGLGAAAAAVEGVKMAAEFQSSLSLLATGAGESRANLASVGQGVLDMAGHVGIGANELVKAMYLVESAGYHGAAGLKVLQAAAEGAKTDGADATDVANALTTVLNDMHAPAAAAATVMSQMVAAVGQGKMRMNDLAGSIHSVLPNASALGLSFAQVAGALATMTAQGIGADQAAQNLNHTIVKLAAPTAGMTSAMARYGLSAQDVAKNLGKEGLTGTLNEIVTAITSHMGPAGLTLINTFNQSKAAAQDAAVAIKALPPAAQQLAEGYAKGTVSLGDFRKALKALPADQAALIMQWKAMEDRSRGFSDSLKSGTPAAQTFTAALKSMMGDQTGLQVALHLSGEHAAAFDAAVKKVGATTADAGGHVKDFTETQKNLSQQWADLQAGIKSLLIELGQSLIPTLSRVLGFVNGNATALGGLVVVVGAALAAWKTYTLTMGAVEAVTKAYSLVMERVAVQQALAAMEGRTLSAVMGIMTVAQIALDAAMDANPIGIVIVGIAALTAGIIYACKNSEMFRNAMVVAFGAVKDFVVAAVGKIVEAWDAFTSALPTVKDKAVAAFGAVVDFAKSLPGKIEGFLSPLPGEVWAILKSAAEKGAYYFGFGLGTIVKLAMELPGKVIGFMQELPGKVWGIIKSLAAKGASAFASFVSAVAGKAASLAAQVPPFIASLVSRVVAFLAGLPGKAVAAIKALPGLIKGVFAAAGTWLLDAGKQIVMGMVNGIKNAAGAAVAAVKDLGGNILSGFKSAMGISSPAKKMIPLGRDIIAGVTEGIKAEAPNTYAMLKSFALKITDTKVSSTLHDSIKKLADHIGAQIVLDTAAVKSLTDKLNEQKQKVAELIKARADYANQIAQGASGGSITSIGLLQLDDQGHNKKAQDDLDTAQQKATDTAQKYADAQDRLNDLMAQQAGRQSTLTDAVVTAQQHLSDLTAQEAARKTSTVAQLQAMQAAQQAVTDAQAASAAQDNSSVAQLQALADAQKAVTDAQVANAASQQNLTTAQDAAKTANTNQATDFLEQLKARVRAAHTFTDDMNKLKAEGLSQDVLQQIAQAGLETGGALAHALATQGTPQTIQGINAMSAKIQEVSTTFGNTWAGQMYDSGVKAAEGIMKGLQSKESAILATIRQLATAMVDEIKKTLKIKSPSGVMRDEVGAMIPAGLIAGITGGAGGVAAAMTSLVGAPGTVAARTGLTAGATAANGASAGGGGTHVHIHMPAGFIGSPDQLATALSDVLQRARNRGTALAF